MDNAKLTLKKVKNHVVTNGVAYAMGAVAVSAIALQQFNRVGFNEFLASKGIDPEEYYCPEAYAEKNEK
jgi:hypothetical protein